MNKEIVKIQIRDMCYYEDDFKYEPIYVYKTNDFEKKFKQLTEIALSYEDFEEINEFIKSNFEQIMIEEKIINI